MLYTSQERTDLIAEAFVFLWADNVRCQKTEAKSYNPGQYWYVTASDLECQVRRFIEEDLEKKKRGSTGRAWGKGYSHVTVRGDLLGDVRKWLLRNPELECHNFGRGHISGARFRPRGAPLHPAEVQTMERKEKRKAKGPITHYRTKTRGGALLCSPKPRSMWSRSRSHSFATATRENVNCPRCQKALAEGRIEPKWACK